MLPTDPKVDSLEEEVIRKTREFIADSDKCRTWTERANRRRIQRLLRDPKAISTTIAITDQVMRANSVNVAYLHLKNAVAGISIAGFGLFNFLGLKLLAHFPAKNIVIKIVTYVIRRYSKDLIIPSEKEVLQKHIAKRSEQGIKLNINVLGEAVLGEDEALQRLGVILKTMEHSEVEFISVKLSSIAAQLVPIDFEGSVKRLSDRLRIVYQQAQKHKVFVTLDMEEFRDLELTVSAFTQVLMEEEFRKLAAGIVLQAYLPEAHLFFEELNSWSEKRVELGGEPIKIRLVKGANLVMEQAEAELQGWAPATFSSKEEVDSSYLRLIDLSLRSENASAIRIGIGSHNLFHLSWAMELARHRGVTGMLDIEMLEGMAEGEAKTLAKSGFPILLYTPVTKHEDFHTAIAYLVRRFDENTGNENYLRASFDLIKQPDTLNSQVEKFKKALVGRHTLTLQSRRHEKSKKEINGFYNQQNGDPTRVSYRKAVINELATYKLKEDLQIVTSVAIDEVIQKAERARSAWVATSEKERLAFLLKAAEIMETQRARTVAVMAHETGKTVAESDPEISEAIDFARFYGIHAVENNDSQPLGVVLIVPPWNFPYAIPAGGIFAALAAGNVVVIKPAPESVATARHLVNQIWEAGIPKEVLQILPMQDDENGKYLVTHRGVNAVILTGSYTTAELFTTWKPDIHLLGETSGKNSILISAGCDIDAAVKDLVQSAFGHAGQKCSAASLAIVDESVLANPNFIKQLVDAVKTLTVGEATDLATMVGPIIRPASDALETALTSLDPGESWLIKPEKVRERDRMWRPGIKVGIKPGSWSHLHEWFGPVLGIVSSPNFYAAVEIQNQTEFGLTAGLQSLDEKECEYWIDHVQAGNLYVNRGTTGAIVNRQPFGGWKRSSVGPTSKAGGRNYVNNLRQWNGIKDFQKARRELSVWWRDHGGNARDESQLSVERNIQRYRKPLAPIAVRFDDSLSSEEIEHIQFIAKLFSIQLMWSGNESLEELLARGAGKVRWLSNERVPGEVLMRAGIIVDPRPLAQLGEIEGPRWLLEQSVSITNHRYGNTNCGAKPRCLGLAAN